MKMTNMNAGKARNGFTLIELLVVITIIVVLAGLLIPGVMRAMKQAKTNRALSEMQHLATVLTQVYSEVGYYVRLEDLAKPNGTYALATGRAWTSNTLSYANGRSDNDLRAGGTDPDTALIAISTTNFWAGPYTTFKNYIITGLIDDTYGTGARTGQRPIDPWGMMGSSNADTHQYRMFWIAPDPSAIPPELLNDRSTWSAAKQQSIPAGAKGAMIIISAGGDGKYQCNITTGKTPADALQADFANFNPVIDKGDDVYYIFNAGIQ